MSVQSSIMDIRTITSELQVHPTVNLTVGPFVPGLRSSVFSIIDVAGGTPTCTI